MALKNGGGDKKTVVSGHSAYTTNKCDPIRQRLDACN